MKREPLLKEVRAVVSMIRGYFVWKEENRKRDRRAAGIIEPHEYQQAKSRGVDICAQIGGE